MPVPVAGAPVPVAAGAPVPQAPVVAVEDEEVPLAVLDVEDEQGLENPEIVEVEDEDVPLANAEVEDTRHAAPYVWGGLLAAALAGGYVGNKKIKQKRMLIAGKDKKNEDENEK